MKQIELQKDNWIYTYYQGIKNGTYCVNKYIRMIYKYLIDGLENKRFYYNAVKANDVIDYFENHVYHTEGPLAPNLVKLEVWEKAALSAIFGIVDKDGFRVFREIFLLVGRKNGKSKLSSGIGKYTFEKNGGYGTRVFCIAPKLEQADIVYNDIWQMIMLDPDWQQAREIANEKDQHNKRINDDSMVARHRQTDLAIPGTNSTVKKIAFSAKKSDGFNPSLTICDEIAGWQGDAGLKQYEVMKSAMGARPEPLIISCTTAGYINDSIFDELFKRSTRFLLGDSKEKRLLPLLYVIDDLEKWNDLNELRKSMPNLGVSVSVDFMLEEIAIAEGSLSKKAEFLCKYCNIKQNSSQAWLPANVVNDASGEHLRLEDFKDSYCVCGIDLSQTVDLSCSIAIIEKFGELYIFAKFFLPAEKIDEATARDGIPYWQYVERGILQPSGENYIDYHDCYNWICSLVEDYGILPLKVGYDRFSAQYLVQDLKQYGFHCDDVYQGDNLFPIIQEMQGLLEDKKIHIGDNDLLKAHLLNSAIKMSAERGRGKLIKLAPNLHVDGVAALLDGLTMRSKYWNEIGEQLKNGD